MYRSPNFLVVGAPKAGTTSMHRYLRAHPQIYVPPRKGLHYFTYECLAARTAGPGDEQAIANFCQTLSDYQAFYQDLPPEATAIGDNSPSYLYFDQCIPRIQELLGDSVKIIIMLRNPIDRAFSNYIHLVNSQRETLSFYEALQAEEERKRLGWGDFWMYQEHSLYCSKVSRYVEAFGADYVKVIVQDDLAADTTAVMQNTFRFLNVDSEFVSPDFNLIYGKGGKHKNRLSEFLAKPHPIKRKVKRIIPRFLFRRLRHLKDAYIERNRVKTAKPDAQSIAFLRTQFLEDILCLEKLLSLNLERWK